jgi:Uma2 family endonuclease
MARVATRSQLTAEEYLGWEREQLDRHEFHDGEVFAMAGGSPRHNVLVGNVLAVVKRVLDGRCFAFTPDQRVVFDHGRRYVYPDASITCVPVEIVANDVLTNPTVLVEVLSEATEAYDRGLKWEGYQQIPSLTDYLLVAQREVRIEHFRRAPDAEHGWFYTAHAAGGMISLANGAVLDVDAIYARAFELPGG